MRFGRAIQFLVLFLTATIAYALAEPQSYQIVDCGREQSFVLSTDELYCLPEDGSAAHLKQFSAENDNRSLIRRAARKNDDSKDQLNLVLYPEGASRSRSNQRILTRKILVEMNVGSSAKSIFLQSNATQYQMPSYAPQFVILEFTSAGDSLAELVAVRALKGVQSANPLLAKYRNKRAAPNDPLYRYSASNDGYQWHLKNTGDNGGSTGVDVNIESLWSHYTGAGITIGVVDDGLQLDHPDLAANTDNTLHHNWNTGAENDPSPGAEDSHGTPCAGVIAAVANNNQGGTGAAPGAQLVGLRLIAEATDDAAEAEAINWPTDINSNSWGPNDAEGALEAAGPLVQAAFKNSTQLGRDGYGTIHVWAAGNGEDGDNVNYDGYANSIYTIAIGSVNDKGARAYYSEPGAAKVVSAPSDDGSSDQGITTTAINSGYTYSFGGTSSATPLAAGVIALMLEANPNLGWRDVQDILIRSARQVSPSDSGWRINGAGIHFSHDFGAGLIDAALAVKVAQSWTNLGTHQTITTTEAASNVTIPDDSTTGAEKTFSISANDNIRVEHVSLTANISHPNRSQLTVSLISPSGIESILGKPESTFDGKANYDNWTFMSVHNWGEEAQGTWRLKVVDSVTGDTGAIDAVILTIYGADVPAPAAPMFYSATEASGTIGAPFYFKVLALEGVSAYTATGLPTGLSFDSATGAISGTPSTNGTFQISLSATNSSVTTSATLTLTIDDQPPAITSQLDVAAFVSRPYSYQIEASNNPTGHTATGLPDGFTFDSDTGLISGTPSAVNVSSIGISASNAAGTTSAVLTLSVIDPYSTAYGNALDNSVQIFDAEPAGSASLWTNQVATTADESDALQSPEIAHNESTAFSTTVTESGILEFWAKTSTEVDYDFLEVTVNGLRILRLSGRKEWKKYVYYLPNNTSNKIAWRYTKDTQDDGGSDQVWVDQVTFTPLTLDDPIASAADFAGLNWPADTKWRWTADFTHDGEDSLQAGAIIDNESSSLSISVEGPGTLSFYYKVSSEGTYDFLKFMVDTSEQLSVSGEVDWTFHEQLIEAGAHTLTWKYAKDVGASEGTDTAWIDQVIWVSDAVSEIGNWKMIHFTPTELNEPNVSGDLMDPDQDGMTNLAEYAFGNNPDATNGDYIPTAEANNTSLNLVYRVDYSRSDSVTVTGKYSTDLVNWITWNDTAHPESGSDILQIRQLNIPYTNGLKGFLRLEVEATNTP